MLLQDLGLVAQVLDDRRLPSLPGRLAVSHCRYSTTGSTVWENAQPTLRLGPRRALAIGHNGNLVNTRELLQRLAGGRSPSRPARTRSCSRRCWPTSRRATRWRPSCGSFPRPRRLQPVVLDERRVIGVRDPFGFRPLVLGRLPAEEGARDGVDAADGAGWVLSSETAGLDVVGADYVRDVEPGELLILEPGEAPARSASRPPARPSASSS